MNIPLVIGADRSGKFAPPLFPSADRPLRIPHPVDAIGLWRSISQALSRFNASSWLIVDSLVLIVGAQLAFRMFDPVSPEDTPHIALWQAMAIFPFATAIASLVFGLYEREALLSRSRILTRMLLVVALSAILAYAVIYVVMYATVSRRVAGFTLAMFFVFGGGFRLVAWWALHRLRRGLLVVGPRSLYESFASAQAEGFLHEYQLVGYAGATHQSPERERRDICEVQSSKVEIQKDNGVPQP